MQDWLATPPGQHLLAWEQQQFDGAVADIFGYHALQLGLPTLDALRTSRMSHRWLATDEGSSYGAPEETIGAKAALVTDFSALPFPAASLDLVLLPHTLETHADPHATLREVERVLVPEGRVVICGMNPVSLWGLRQRRAQLYRRFGLGEPYLPQANEYIGYWRLRDWLRLLGFEVEAGHFGSYRPAVRSAKWLNRFDWMDALGARWWPIFGAAYCVVAVKRVHGMRLLEPAWKAVPKRAAAPVPLTRRSGDNQARADNGAPIS